MNRLKALKFKFHKKNSIKDNLDIEDLNNYQSQINPTILKEKLQSIQFSKN